jgi:hypothetical protein
LLAIRWEAGQVSASAFSWQKKNHWWEIQHGRPAPSRIFLNKFSQRLNAMKSSRSNPTFWKLSTLTMEAKIVSETLDYKAILKQLIARKHFTVLYINKKT